MWVQADWDLRLACLLLLALHGAGAGSPQSRQQQVEQQQAVEEVALNLQQGPHFLTEYCDFLPPLDDCPALLLAQEVPPPPLSHHTQVWSRGFRGRVTSMTQFPVGAGHASGHAPVFSRFEPVTGLRLFGTKCLGAPPCTFSLTAVQGCALLLSSLGHSSEGVAFTIPENLSTPCPGLAALGLGILFQGSTLRVPAACSLCQQPCPPPGLLIQAGGGACEDVTLPVKCQWDGWTCADLRLPVGRLLRALKCACLWGACGMGPGAQEDLRELQDPELAGKVREEQERVHRFWEQHWGQVRSPARAMPRGLSPFDLLLAQACAACVQSEGCAWELFQRD